MPDSEREQFRSSFDVSRETMDLLDIYCTLLLKWNRTVNLVAKSTETRMWSRHIADAAQLDAYIEPSAREVADFGSGGGLPAIVLAILAQERWPDRHFTLLESDRRKASFLNTAIRELGIRAECLPERIEAAPPLNADIITARAFAPLERLLPLANIHLKPDGVLVLLKGKTYQEELANASKAATFSVDISKSLANSEGVVIKITDLKLSMEK